VAILNHDDLTVKDLAAISKKEQEIACRMGAEALQREQALLEWIDKCETLIGETTDKFQLGRLFQIESTRSFLNGWKPEE
jgi:acyl transferase domain-containing protein